MKKNYKFLDTINFPSDLRKFKDDDLQKISDEIREEIISAVSETGGHLGASLGVVELTVALHYVFDTPNDKLIFKIKNKLKKYGPNSKNLHETLDYILNRDK